MDKKISVLDKGFVELVDSMGSDQRVVEAARVSTGQGTKTPEQDAKLIKYLMKNGHTSPFEKVRFEFHIKAPIFVARQFVRHRVCSWNEISARYATLEDEFYIPEPDEIKGQGKMNKQGSDGELSCELKADWRYKVEMLSDMMYQNYLRAMRFGISREMARIILPLNIYTEWYWGMDLHNLLNNFIKKRADWHAQPQIQAYATAIESFVKEVVPISYQAWKEVNDKD